jgi:glycosyltransferase involved in cell wall biosynthesis
MPRVLIATILPAEGKTGMHTHIQSVARYLDLQGVPVEIITPFSWGGLLRYPVFGVRYLLEPLNGTAAVLWYRHWHEVFVAKALKSKLADGQETIIYAQDPLAARAALRSRLNHQQKVVLVLHFVGSSEADEWIDNKRITPGGIAPRRISEQERGIIPGVDRLIYLSPSRQSAILSHIPEAASVRSAVIPNFVMTEYPKPAGVELMGDLVTVGRLEQYKNHRYLLRVLAKTKERGRALTLDIYGDGPCRDELAKLAKTLDVDDLVRFRGFRDDLNTALPCYAVYVHSAIKEGLPYAILEAMAAGLPVIAGNVGGIADLCADDGTVRCWPLDDPNVGATMLLDLFSAEGAISQAGRAARRRFEQEFHVDAVGPRLLEFLAGK